VGETSQEGTASSQDALAQSLMIDERRPEVKMNERKGIDPLFAPKDDRKTWADIIPELKPWKCCGCGAPSPDRKRACDCATNCVSRNGEIATKIDGPPDSRCYDLAERFLEDEPHLNTDRRRNRSKTAAIAYAS